MTFSLHAATIPPYLQILGSVARLVDKAEAWCAETGTPAEEVITARLIADMLPFTYQVKSTAEHSIGAILAVREGFATPSLAMPPGTFTELRDKVAAAQRDLAALDPTEVDGFVGKPVRFEFKEMRRDFTAESFLTGYALPNFYFHAVTAYDLLRARGVHLGKRDFLGALPATAA
ncbi:DUF1993 domain-containing protein [Caulobacter sp. KR2-114]|jgi:hypothetical protein|uniref:DUF1993 domain-containing protein n=1 Tax=Caulobacter sp. KR2-114 TaxID=3400912 RepID=UPI003BFC2D9F